MTEAKPIPKEQTELPARRRVVNELWTRLEHADPGTLAALRRAGGSDELPTAFYRFTVGILDEHYEKLPEGGEYRDEFEKRWGIVVAAMANAKGLLARIPLGRALAEADVAELRVVRLLEAEGDQLPDIVRTIVHQLVSKGQPFDPQDLAHLVLEPENKEPRRRIARDFYRHQQT